MVVLRDGRTLIGYLRSIDQFGECSEDMIDHCNYIHNLSSCEIKAEKIEA